MAAGGVGVGLTGSSGADRDAGVCGTTGDSRSEGAGTERVEGDTGRLGRFVGDEETFGEVVLVDGGVLRCAEPDGAPGGATGVAVGGGAAATGEFGLTGAGVGFVASRFADGGVLTGGVVVGETEMTGALTSSVEGGQSCHVPHPSAATRIRPAAV